MRNRTLSAIVFAAALLVAIRPIRPQATSDQYGAITDRIARPKPRTAAPAAAGGRFTDSVFGSRMLRVTDGNTRPGARNVSYRSPSGSHQNAWSASGNYFYVISTDGSVVPFAFNRTTVTASRINPSTLATAD